MWWTGGPSAAEKPSSVPPSPFISSLFLSVRQNRLDLLVSVSFALFSSQQLQQVETRARGWALQPAVFTSLHVVCNQFKGIQAMASQQGQKPIEFSSSKWLQHVFICLFAFYSVQKSAAALSLSHDGWIRAVWTCDWKDTSGGFVVHATCHNNNKHILFYDWKVVKSVHVGGLLEI